MSRLFLTAIVLLFATHSAFSENKDLVTQWYSALKTSDRNAFNELLAYDASLDIRPLEVIQTKTEYIEALDNWEEVSKDLTLIVKDINPTGKTTVRAQVCYRFLENSFMNEERFVFSEGKIIGFSQNRQSDKC